MAVTFISHGYDTTVGNPYTESAWAEAFPSIGLATYGVREELDWKVTAVAGQDRTVSIAEGRGFGYGVTDETEANDTIQLDTISSGSRWDLIAVRRDWTPTGGESKFVKVNGGATAVIPGGRQSTPGNIDDQPIALVQVTAGQTQPTSIIDLRTWSGDGAGLVANHDLVRTFLDAVGTRLWINGIDWVRKVGANDTPEWEDVGALEASADISTFSTGWTATAGSGHKPRLRRVGNMVHLYGSVTQGSTANVTSILTIPTTGGFRPTDASSTFVGTGVTSNKAAYQLLLANGVLSIAYFSGTFPVGSAVPVTASWPIS